MTGFILATKVKQTSGFDEQKKRQTYTLLKLSPCYVTQVKTKETDSYRALQIGFLNKNPKNITSVLKGQTKKAGIESPLSFLAEIKLEDYFEAKEIKDKEKVGYQIGDNTYFPGTQIKPEVIFSPKDKVEVSGTTKGKGFAGVVKRHHFAGGPKTHGQSDRLRAPGAIGSGTTPGRIWKGKRMAGRMGGDSQTIKGLMVVKVDSESILLQGLVPGSIGGVITILSQKNG